jgi:hypothetical protein
MVTSKEKKVLPKICTSFAAITHLAEGLSLYALLTLKVENFLICRVGTKPAVSMMRWQLILPLKTIRNKIISNEANGNRFYASLRYV